MVYSGNAVDHLVETARMTKGGLMVPSAYQKRFDQRMAQGGQNPHITEIACYDSDAVRHTSTTHASCGPNKVGTGDTAGNLLAVKTVDLRTMEPVWTSTIPAGYFTQHVRPHGDNDLYLLVTEAHSDCGFINVFLKGNYGSLPGSEAALYNALASVEELMDPELVDYARKVFGESDRTGQLKANAQVAVENTDTQINKIMELFPEAASSPNWIPVGTYRDFGDLLYDGAKGSNRIHITNIGGKTDRYDMLNHPLIEAMRDAGATNDELETLVRRPNLL